MSKNFIAKEFKCNCGECKQPEMNQHLVAVLELVRLQFGKPITITSAYRCKDYNFKVGGAINSQHPKNNAADIVVKDISPEEVYDFLDETFNDVYGLGLYIEQGFVHVDVRPNIKARW